MKAHLLQLSSTNPLGTWYGYALLTCLVSVVAVVAASQPALAYDCEDMEAMEKLARDAKKNPDGQPRIQHLELTCDLGICREPGVLESFRDLIDLCVGAPYSEGIGAAAVNRLDATGFFQKVRVKQEEVPGGFSVRLDLIGATVIRGIRYEGVEPLLESEVERRLQLRKGRPFKANLDELQRQSNAIRELYEKNGYYGTKVDVQAVSVGEGSKLVDIKINIDKGVLLYVGKVSVAGRTAQGPPRKEIRRELLSEMGWWACYDFVPPFRLYCFTDQRFKQGIDAVKKMYRDRGNYKVRVQGGPPKKDIAGEKANLSITIEEGPRWELVFVGNQIFNVDELKDQTTFAESGFVDQAEIRNSVESIRAFYETAGHYFTDIKAKEVEREKKRQVVFEIDEGPASEIVSVKLVGNSAKPADFFLSMLGTQPVELLTDGYLQSAQLDADIKLIAALYHDLGYLSATIDRWKLVARNERQDLYITVDVDEGEATTVGELAVDGNVNISTASLRELLKTKPGRAFSLSQLQADAKRILEVYRPLGYPQASVNAQCSVMGGPYEDCVLPQINPECLPGTRQQRDQLGLCTRSQQGDAYVETCRWVPDDVACMPQGGIQSSFVDVRLTIKEGKRIRIGEILLRGNFRTRPGVISSEFPFEEGDLLVESELLQGQRNLRSLGLFDSVSFVPLGIEEDEINAVSDRDRAALLVTVEEAKARFVELGVGAELRNALDDDRTFIARSEQALTENNLFGFGKQTQLKLLQAVDLIQVLDRTVGNVESQDLAGVRELVEIDYFIATELVYHDPRFLFPNFLDGGDSRKAVDFSLTPFYTLDLLGAEDQTLDKEEYGARTAFRFKPIQKVTLELGLERKTTATRRKDEDVRDLEGNRLFDPWRNTTAVSFRPVWDTRNSPLNPSRGFIADATLKYAFNILDSPINFIKLTLKWSQFFPVLGDVVFGYDLRAGQAFPLADTTVIPDDERFRLGGVSSVRGFEDDGVGPRDELFQPQGGEFLALGHVELRYPIWRSIDLYGAYFLDTGLLVDCLEDHEIFEPEETVRVSCYEDVEREDLRTAAGLGLRWVIAGQIPLVLDYGVVLDREPGEDVGDFVLNVGYVF